MKTGDVTIRSVPRSIALKLQDIRRHFDTHKKKKANPKKQTEKQKFDEKFAKLNIALTIKTAAQLYPTFSTNPEELAFWYRYGQVAVETGTNPLRKLNFHRKTRASHCQKMAVQIYSELKTMLQNELNYLKKQKEIKRVVAISANFDHAYSPATKCHLGMFTVSIRICDLHQKDNNVKYYFPAHLFEIRKKDDKTIAANATQIIKFINDLLPENPGSVSVVGDGAIVIPGLIQALEERSINTKHPFLGGKTFTCCCHQVFLIIMWGFHLSLDDVESKTEFNNFFPSHKARNGKKIFFFDPIEEFEMKEYLPYFMRILSNLETTSPSTNVALTDYITELQKIVLTSNIEKRRKEFSAHSKSDVYEQQLLDDMSTHMFTSSDPMEYYKRIYFGEDVEDECTFLKMNPLKVPNDPGRKSRRMMNMCEKLVTVIKFADCVTRNHFGHVIQVPQSQFPNMFVRKMGQFTALLKYLVAKADSSDANNITLYRVLCIISRAAFNLDADNIHLYDILENPLIG